MIWYDFGPIRTSGSIVSTLTLHSLTGTLKGPGSFVILSDFQIITTFNQSFTQPPHPDFDASREKLQVEYALFDNL